ncbi:MAG: YbaB/EbfC family nucleoid-associated protein [Kiritimatiellae bacterium]|nr:YbaB/EbfC family nucleoid-associated protein [Kiritimatiellia bacterium]
MASIFEQAKQALKMRSEAKRIQQEVERIVVEYSNGGIHATMKGDFTLSSLKIDDEALEELRKGKTDRFTTMIQNVFNGAMKKAKDATQQRMQQMMKEGGLSGIFG